MQIKNTSIEILEQLINLTEQLREETFVAPLDLLFNNSIGKHLRHIVEFYQLLIDALESGIVSYDKRSHDQNLETDKELTIKVLKQIKSVIQEAPENVKLEFNGSYSLDSNDQFTLESCYKRELVYNIEHAIHHMAIIKIAIKASFPNINLPDNFGIAYSTVKYHNQFEE